MTTFVVVRCGPGVRAKPSARNGYGLWKVFAVTQASSVVVIHDNPVACRDTQKKRGPGRVTRDLSEE